MLLQVPPDRIGHGTFMHPSVGGNKEMEELVSRLKIPIGEVWDISFISFIFVVFYCPSCVGDHLL